MTEKKSMEVMENSLHENSRYQIKPQLAIAYTSMYIA